MVNKPLKLVLFTILLFISISFVSAWDFYGYAYDVNGTALYNASINVTIWTMGAGPPSLVGSNVTYSNQTGWFNFSVTENSSWMYKPVVRHFAENKTDGSTSLDYIGQSLPTFPYTQFANITNINFYLREAGTINITAVNATGSAKTFQYVVKDTKLGYPIAEGFGSYVSQATVYVPRNRNYTIQIYPNQSMPVSYHWNNFSATSDYNLTSANISSYNATNHTLHKKFNCSESLVWVSGYIKNSTGQNLAGGWDEFKVVPFVLEAGNMVYLGDNAAMPYNMSAWKHDCGFTTVTNQTNAYINSTGYQLTPTGKYNYNLTSVWVDWNQTNGSQSGVINTPTGYNVSIPVANLTTNFSLSVGGVLTNATNYVYPNASLTYTYTSACSDQYNLTSGFYNITLVGPVEAMNYILFATARNGTNYYGGYRNISLNYSSNGTQINFTMYKLMSTAWNTSTSNITMNDASDWSSINISSAKKAFNLVNATTNATLENVNAHIEVTVDYSDYNATEFIFMTDLSNENGTFYLPLINATVKEMNIYTNNYAPKCVGTRTVAQILANNNITMASFNPGDIEGHVSESNIFIELYKSNSTCDVPNPPSSCMFGSSGNMGSFNPLSAIIGGGAISFRMGYGNIEIHYVNVDMLASGPPDILFDDSATTSTTGAFESALRFGSNGPTIYDYVIVSIPYTPGSSSQTGLNEESQVNVSIPLLYNENWNVIWNTTANGTNGTFLAGNDTHYSTYSSEWETLMGNNTCITNVSNFNATNPCYINTGDNQIWIRLPHFSGAGPSITGSVITATTTSTTASSPGGGTDAEVKKTHSWTKITPGAAAIMKDFDKEIGIKQIQIEVKNEAQDVKVSVTKYSSKPAEVSLEKSGKVYKYLQIKTENLEDKLDKAILTIQVEKNWTSENNISEENVAVFKFDNSSEEWNELETIYTEADDDYYYYDVEVDSFSYFAIGEKVLVSEKEEEEALKEKGLGWWWVAIIAGIIIIAYLIFSKVFRKRKRFINHKFINSK